MFERIGKIWQSAIANHDGKLLEAVKKLLVSFLKSNLTSGNILSKTSLALFLLVALLAIEGLRVLRYLVEEIFFKILRRARIVLAAVLQYLSRQWSHSGSQGEALVEVLKALTKRLDKKLSSDLRKLTSSDRKEDSVDQMGNVGEPLCHLNWAWLCCFAIGRSAIWLLSLAWAAAVSVSAICIAASLVILIARGLEAVSALLIPPSPEAGSSTSSGPSATNEPIPVEKEPSATSAPKLSENAPLVTSGPQAVESKPSASSESDPTTDSESKERTARPEEIGPSLVPAASLDPSAVAAPSMRLSPIAPSNLSVRTTGTSTAHLSWTDNSSNELGFKLEHKSANSDSWKEIRTIASDETRTVISGLAAGTNHSFRVRSFVSTGYSGFSNEVSVTRCMSQVSRILVGQTMGGFRLQSPDCKSTIRPGSYYDRINFVATANTEYTIRMISEDFDPYLALIDSSDLIVARNDDSSRRGSQIEFTAKENGRLSIEATSYSSGATGVYTITLSAAVAPGMTDDVCQEPPRVIHEGESLHGNLAPSDCFSTSRPRRYCDRFAFAAKAGTQYTVRMTTTDFDSYLHLQNSAGTVIAENDDGGGSNSSQILYKAQKDEVVTIEATSLVAKRRGSYILSLSFSKSF